MEQISYVMVKPGFAKHTKLISYVVEALENAGLKIEDKGYALYTKELAAEHYVAHVGRGYYQSLEDYITSGPAYGIVVSGENAIAVVDALKGSTKNPQPDTLRYALKQLLTEEELEAIFVNPVGTEARKDEETTKNGLHASDCPEAGRAEAQVFSKAKKNFEKVMGAGK